MKMIKSVLMGLMLAFSTLAFAGPVNINKADAPTLAQELNGVGEKKAQLIVEYRDRNGAFKTVDDLAGVKGIGSKTVDKNRENIRL